MANMLSWFQTPNWLTSKPSTLDAQLQSARQYIVEEQDVEKMRYRYEWTRGGMYGQ